MLYMIICYTLFFFVFLLLEYNSFYICLKNLGFLFFQDLIDLSFIIILLIILNRINEL